MVYVVDCYNHCVKVLRGLDGRCVRVLGRGQGSGRNQMDEPKGVAVDDFQVYIADTANHRVLVYSKESGEFEFEFGEGDGLNEDTQFDHPCAVSVDIAGEMVYVADFDHSCVFVYSRSGGYVNHFQVLQEDNTEAQPSHVMWDAAGGALYVTLEDSTTICRYE
eukprot:TRINITY_DN14669_c0_g3_i1.p1 TRINITY_DN14669_c0_g3~~TRINITY_DN14669_c0_g3_i1.p1  ORF type:complete len:163 (+),score=33.21 TRINITY_DN14669_c0_g3_i1:444-932(+)